MTEPAPKKARSRGPMIAGAFILTSVVVIPLLLLFVIFPWVMQQAFQSADELKIDELEGVRVQLLNHPANKPDIAKIAMDPADFEAVLAPLRNAEKIQSIPPSALLGEYQIRFKDGRRGTIRLRFQPANKKPEDAPVWMEIGSSKYKLGTLGPLWAIAEECAPRGQK